MTKAKAKGKEKNGKGQLAIKDKEEEGEDEEKEPSQEKQLHEALEKARGARDGFPQVSANLEEGLEKAKKVCPGKAKQVQTDGKPNCKKLASSCRTSCSSKRATVTAGRVWWRELPRL